MLHLGIIVSNEQNVTKLQQTKFLQTNKNEQNSYKWNCKKFKEKQWTTLKKYCLWIFYHNGFNVIFKKYQQLSFMCYESNSVWNI